MSDTKRLKCWKCGAMKEQTAENKCKPTQDMSGDYSCPMDYVKTDKNGWFITDRKVRKS